MCIRDSNNLNSFLSPPIFTILSPNANEVSCKPAVIVLFLRSIPVRVFKLLSNSSGERLSKSISSKPSIPLKNSRAAPAFLLKANSKGNSSLLSSSTRSVAARFLAVLSNWSL